MPLCRRSVRTLTSIAALTLTLVVGTATAAAPAGTCTLRVQSHGTSGFRSGLTAGSCVNPSLRTGVDDIAAGNSTGKADFTVFSGADCTGTVLAQATGEAFFVPPIDIGSVRIDSCP
ncbi:MULTISPECIES: hypothetical protein [Streptomyces]|uniref:Secreted protein n=1 Tax=Streptomyces luteosporeus TaxID=173856 RepID=A0ABP6GLX3_9ACTN